MRTSLAVVLCFATASTAFAAGYEEFVKAGTAKRAGNAEQAIAGYSAALNAGDLAAAYVPDAYFGRGELYFRQGKCGMALTDLDAALKARPNMLEALQARAHVNDCLSKPEAARADLDSIVAIMPSVESYMNRGGYAWFHGAFDKAAEDYAKAASLTNKKSIDWRGGVFSLIWYAISAKRDGHFDAADYAAKAKPFDLDRWPGPVVRFYLGKASADDVAKAAAKGEGDILKTQNCEADFFQGEWLIAGGTPEPGKVLLSSIQKSCPGNLTVTSAAKTDLRRLP